MIERYELLKQYTDLELLDEIRNRMMGISKYTGEDSEDNNKPSGQLEIKWEKQMERNEK